MPTHIKKSRIPTPTWKIVSPRGLCIQLNLSKTNLRPVVDRQPGSPRNKTRREGSACDPWKPVRIMEPVKQQGVLKIVFWRHPTHMTKTTWKIETCDLPWSCRVSERVQTEACALLGAWEARGACPTSSYSTFPSFQKYAFWRQHAATTNTTWDVEECDLPQSSAGSQRVKDESCEVFGAWLTL